MASIYERLKALRAAIADITKGIFDGEQPLMENSEILYDTALTFLGRDASPNDLAPDEYGCAESVNALHKAAFGHEIGGSTSTTKLWRALSTSPLFERTHNPEPGDIIISPTGYGTTGRISNGHVGIVGRLTSPDGSCWVMSNDSRTGTFEANFTINSWRRYYEQRGGFPVYFYHRL